MNNDGNADMITGEYWPGDIYVFYGSSDGTFAKMETLKDESDRNLNGGDEWKSERQPNMKSLAAAPFATDWDGDGDFDMLIGNIEGTVTLMKNIGTKQEPLFSTTREVLQTEDGEIRVNADAGPVFEDWDADGLRDLVIGGGDGAVVWYKNIGKEDAPKFGASQTLLAASSLGHNAVPHDQEPNAPGTRVKVNVVDYDQDGMVDLLVGDFLARDAATKELSEEQVARRDELKQKIDKFNEKFQELYSQFEAKEEEFENSDAMQEAMEALQKEADPNNEMQAMMQEYGDLSGTSKYHGYVWLYTRLAMPTSVATLP